MSDEMDEPWITDAELRGPARALSGLALRHDLRLARHELAQAIEALAARDAYISGLEAGRVLRDAVAAALAPTPGLVDPECQSCHHRLLIHGGRGCHFGGCGCAGYVP